MSLDPDPHQKIGTKFLLCANPIDTEDPARELIPLNA